MLQDCKLLAFDELNGILNESPNSNTCFEISQTQAPRAGKGKLIQQEQTAEIPPPKKKVFHLMEEELKLLIIWLCQTRPKSAVKLLVFAGGQSRKGFDGKNLSRILGTGI